MAKKTTAAQRRRRFAQSVPDVWVTHPPYQGQFLALRLKRGRKVLQRTLTQEEADFLVWQLGWSFYCKTPGAANAKDALLQAFDRCQAEGPRTPLAQVVVNLLPDGRVQISSTCAGRFDSSYAPVLDGRAPPELNKLLVELRQRLCEGG